MNFDSSGAEFNPRVGQQQQPVRQTHDSAPPVPSTGAESASGTPLVRNTATLLQTRNSGEVRGALQSYRLGAPGTTTDANAVLELGRNHFQADNPHLNAATMDVGEFLAAARAWSKGFQDSVPRTVSNSTQKTGGTVAASTVGRPSVPPQITADGVHDFFTRQRFTK